MGTVREVCDWLDQFAPKQLAATWDVTGLLLGERDAQIERILTCLSVTPGVVQQAIQTRTNLIVSHHPILFRGTKNLSSDSVEGRLLLPLLQHRVAVYSPHTRFDDCPGGINDDLCEALSLQAVKPLRDLAPHDGFKLITFVPHADVDRVLAGLFQAGAGHIGAYRECSFRHDGTGTFFGAETTNPVVGERGRREEVLEQRIEVVVPPSLVASVVAALKQVHPYEEPAFDILPTKQVSHLGSGRIGRLPAPTSLSSIVEQVRTKLEARQIQFVGPPDRLIRTVAVACGAAGEYLADAIKQQADAFLMGEVRFHEALSAEANGIALVLPGHFASERPSVVRLATMLQTQFPKLNVDAATETDPLQTLA